jgi:hypothetical protein
VALKPTHSDSAAGLLNALTTLIRGLVLLIIIVLLYEAFKNQMPEFRKPTGTIQTYTPGSDIFSMEVDSTGHHVATGLVFAPGLIEVQRNCLACHSSKLITQTSASREGWIQIISWMQRPQGLWDLGEDEGIVLDYLATHYAPEERGRRANLEISAIEWYELEE